MIYMRPRKKAMAKKALPRNAMATCMGSQKLLRAGESGIISPGMNAAVRMRISAKGVTNAPSVFCLYLKRRNIYVRTTSHEKNMSDSCRFVTGVLPACMMRLIRLSV